MSKPKGYSYINICGLCGKKFTPPNRQPHAKYCGSARRREGCSYKNQLNLSVIWRNNNHKRSNIICRDFGRRKRNTLSENYRGSYILKGGDN